MGVAVPAFFVPARARSRWRAWLVAVVCLLAAGGLEAQRRHGPSPLDTIGSEVDQESGRQILERYRSLGVAGAYRFGFELSIMPRREATRRLSGSLVGTQGETGPITRVDLELAPAEVTEQGQLAPGKVRRLLLQNGPEPRVHEWVGSGEDGEGALRLVPVEERFEGLAGSDFTIFDLLMPFNYWQRSHYEGRTTFRGRPTHVFWVYPPEADVSWRSHVSGTRLFIDEEFGALIQVEIYDAQETHAKTISIVDFRKVQGQWILGQVDVRDERSRDKTRLKVLDARLDADVPRWVFAPEGLERPVHGTAVGLQGAAE